MKQQKLKPLPGVLLFLWVLGALTGCIHQTGTAGRRPSPPQMKTVYLILHGPFAVIVRKSDLLVLVPHDQKHELAVFSPEATEITSDSGECTNSIQLNGVPEHDGTTWIDSKLSPVIEDVPDWDRRQDPSLEKVLEKQFVVMRLPRPARILGLAPQYPVEFGSKPSKELVSLTLWLEFHVTNIEHVELAYTKSNSCKAEKRSSQAGLVSCHDMQQRFQNHWDHPYNPDEEPSRTESLQAQLADCETSSKGFFVGVGLPPNEAKNPKNAGHGSQFFNEKLLRLAYGDTIPQERKIYSIPYETIGGSWALPKFMLAAYRSNPPWAMPMFASTENCKSPGIVVVTQ